MGCCDVAWAAGFFDGEGSVSLLWRQGNRRHGQVPASRGKWWHLQLTLTNTDVESLQKFREVMGVGNVYPRKIVDGRRQVYFWVATSLAAEVALKALLPYLVTKQAVGQLALESRSLGQLKPYARISVAHWQRMIEIENGIKQFNGRNYQKVEATERMRMTPYIEV
jgi:hypothetical protein